MLRNLDKYINGLLQNKSRRSLMNLFLLLRPSKKSPYNIDIMRHIWDFEIFNPIARDSAHRVGKFPNTITKNLRASRLSKNWDRSCKWMQCWRDIRIIQSHGRR